MSLETRQLAEHPRSRSPRLRAGFTLVEMLIAVAITALIMAVLGVAANTTLAVSADASSRNDLAREAGFALQRMVGGLSRSQQLLVPMVDNPTTGYSESLRDPGVLAFALDPNLDRDLDGIADADNDGDGRVDEDLPRDTNNDGAIGLKDIDDNNDGVPDNSSAGIGDDDESGFFADGDPINGVDDDADGNVDEDPPADTNGDGASGAAGVDDDGDGSIDEATAEDDDEDGVANEDWLDTVAYFLSGSDLVERHPNLDPVDGTAYTERVIAQNVTLFRVERLPRGSNRADLVEITLGLGAETTKLQLQTRVRVGGAVISRGSLEPDRRVVCPSDGGYLLLPVALTLVVVGALAFLLSRQGPMGGRLVQGETEAEAARYVAAAGLAHAEWTVKERACRGDFSLAAAPLGAHSYSAMVAAGGGTTAYNLAADQDAWIRSDQPTTVNGTNPDQHIRFEAGNVEHALFRFDLSSLPADARINSATAWFYVKSTGAHPEGRLTIHRVLKDWSEADATWDSMNGEFDSRILAMIPAQPVGDVWVRINLTAQVQSWVNGEANYGVLLASSVEGVHAHYISREGAAGQQPRLEVVVGSAPASPVAISATGTLANGVTRNLGRPVARAYQTPGKITLQLGSDPGEDTILDSFYPRNFGGSNYLQVSADASWLTRTLLRFDISGIPAGASVLSARLELRMWSVNAPGTASVHRVTRDWVEGTRNGGGIADGATWDTYDGTNVWTSAGGDFSADVVAEAAIGSSDTWVAWDIAPLVEQWLAGAVNHGLLIQGGGGLRGADFASQSENSPSAHPKLTITYACECGTACLALQGSGNLLMVVGDDDPSSIDPTDAYKQALFESWGYTVALLNDNTSQTAYDNAVANNDVAYVTGTVSETSVGTSLSNAAIGVVSEKGALNDELGLASGSGQAVGSAIEVVDASHYITWPFPAGALTIYDDDMLGTSIAGTPAPDLQSLAAWGAAAGLVALDTGAGLFGGGTAAGRRVGLPIGGGADIDASRIGSNGRLIVQRALKWAMSVGESPTVLLVVGNAGAPSSKDSGRKALMESWGFTVTLIDDGDSQANFDTAAEAHDVVYVSGTIGGGALADKLSGSPRPIVNEFPGKLDNFGFSSGTSTAVSAADFFKTNASHYITEVFSVDPVTVFSASLAMPVPSGTIASGLEFAGSVLAGASQVPALVTLDAGALRWDGDPAPARRVHLPFASAETTQLTVDGETIMRRAIDWARGAEATAMGPIAHWKLDEAVGPTALDSTGNGHDGTWVGDPASAPGKVDGGLDFDGVNDYVDVPHEDELLLTGGMTFIAWATTLDTSGGYKAIISKDAPGNGASNYWFGTEDDELVFGFWAGGSFRTVKTSTENLALGTWHHLAASFDNATDGVRLYVDGTAVQEGSIADEPTTESADLWIGRSVDGEYWDGLLDDVRIYDRVLSDSEISDLAAAAGGGGPPPSVYTEDDYSWNASSANAWQAVNLSAAGVPANAVLEVAVQNTDGSFERWGGVRSFGSSLDRRLRLHEAENGGSDVVTLHVQADASSRIEHYAENTGEITFTLLGYWTLGAFVERAQWFTANNNDVWEDHDLAGYGVPSAAVAEIVIVNTDPAAERLAGVRADGSLQNRRLSIHEAENGGVDAASFFVNASNTASARVEIWADDTADIEFLLTGYWSTPPGTYVEAGGVHGLPASPGVWEQGSLGTFGVPGEAVVQISLSNEADTTESWMGVRRSGSSLDRTLDLQEAEFGGSDLATLHVVSDVSSNVEWYSELTADRYFYVLGWWVVTPP